jgi:alkylglycerol monooxygenase
MDRKNFAVWVELSRSVCALVLIVITGDWFGIEAYLPWGKEAVALYFVASMAGGLYFTFLEHRVSSSNKIALK